MYSKCAILLYCTPLISLSRIVLAQASSQKSMRLHAHTPNRTNIIRLQVTVNDKRAKTLKYLYSLHHWSVPAL